MFSKDIQKRLAQLNRAPVVEASVEQTTEQARDPNPPIATPAKSTIFVPESARGADRGLLRLEEAVPGQIVQRPDGGAYWLIERRLSEIAAHCRPFTHRYGELLGCDVILLPEGLRRDLIAFTECRCERVLYLDIETTSLSGTRPLFLVGVMFFDGEDFVIRQYFARDYAEEAHLLADLCGILPGFDMLVTFNGRSFDAPYIHDRCRLNRLELRWPARHFDLLYESRRRWSKLLPNCRLVTLEEFLCNRRRVDDIPSAMIPAAYHEFVHTEDASKMRHVIHHNALDLVTMAELALFMLVGRKDWE